MPHDASRSARIEPGPLTGAEPAVDTRATMPIHTQIRPGSEPTTARWSPPALPTLVSSCALVATAYLLGASWLGTPILAIPLGVWFLPAVFAVVRWCEQLIDDWRALEGGAALVRPAPGTRPARSRAAWRRAARAGTGALRFFTSIPERLAESARATSHGAAIDHPGMENERLRAPTEPEARHPRSACAHAGRRPRVVIDAPSQLAAALLEAPGSDSIEWRARESGIAGNGAGEHLEPDAILRATGTTGLTVELAGTDRSDSAWLDWAEPPAASYPGVFPARLDPARIAFSAVDLRTPSEAQTVRALADAGVLLKRGARSGPEGEWARHRAGLVIDRLRHAVSSAALRARHDEASRIAGRVVSAWLLGGTARLGVEQILEGVEASARLVGDEPIMLLRLAAARLAAAEDEAGLAALRRATEALQAPGASAAIVDQTPFVQGELEIAAEDDDLAVGRIAAGLCLCFARAEPQAAAHLSEDLLDDMRYSPALLGRDQDRAALMRVLRHLERWKRGPHHAHAQGRADAAAPTETAGDGSLPPLATMIDHAA